MLSFWFVENGRFSQNHKNYELTFYSKIGVDRFDRCSKTLHCACVQYVTYSVWKAGATAQTTPIFNKSSTLVFLAVRIPMWNIFRYEYSIHMRMLHKKNKQNWTSGSWDIGIVLHLRSDRYSVRGIIPWIIPKNLNISLNLNQNRKYFSPLVSDPGRFEW